MSLTTLVASSAEVKSVWSSNSTPAVRLHDVYGDTLVAACSDSAVAKSRGAGDKSRIIVLLLFVTLSCCC